METKITELKNKIEFAYKRNPNTPRVAFYLNFSINNYSKNPGMYSLLVRLFMQGTKTVRLNNCQKNWISMLLNLPQN